MKSDFKKKIERSNKISKAVISLGGYGVIFSIIGIFLFLLYETIPLFYGAKVDSALSFKLNKKKHIVLSGVDQYKELSYLISNNGEIDFFNLKEKQITKKDTLPLAANEIITTGVRNSNGDISLGTDKGRILFFNLNLKPVFRGSKRRIVPKLELKKSFRSDVENPAENNGIKILAFSENDDGVLYWAWVNAENKLLLKIYDPDEDEYFDFSLSDNLENVNVTTLAINPDQESLIAGDDKGELYLFDLSDHSEPDLLDNWKASDSKITAIEFLIGNNTLIVGNKNGEVSSWFEAREKGSDELKYREVHTFQKMESEVVKIVSSPRNRLFLVIDGNGKVNLDYSTTGNTELEFSENKSRVVSASFAPKADGIFLVNSKNEVSLFKLDDEHPDVSWKTLFGKVWYEGYPGPAFVWQSTGGTDSFESKFSLIPLIFGTLKGTFYAMIFAIPIALFGAIYVSQFAPKRFAKIIKPTVEIMAALPSVVIGFLAGLYFSPLFEHHLMLIFLLSVLAPALFLILISFWGMIPERKRRTLPAYYELGFVLFVMAAVYYFSSIVSLPLEKIFFNGDLKQWLYSSLNVSYDQRNSLVVGFALGFAVIPIIFTIAEDALSNVPASLSSASLALGASKWQTVKRVVLPAAAGGIFAGVMLGLGRAIGETMIVLMATGNTPIMDLSPFDGFRAMSANIAVEIPEAPVDGSLYRVLFLTALLLLIFTFIINSFATYIGDKLRKKYARY